MSGIAAVRPLRLGVFGSAFDPPHLAHRAVLEAALAQLQLDRLHLLPTGQAWHKARALSDARHRVAMAELAFADLPGVIVDRREVDRAGPSYTIDSLRELQREFPGASIYLLIGQDQAQNFQGWREWEAICALATICVAARPQATGQTDRTGPPTDQPQGFMQLQLPLSAVSATEIRHRVRSGQGIVPLVGDAVARYIVLHRLYLST